MSIIIGFSALVIAIIGFVIWWAESKPSKIWAEFGKLVFFCGFLAFCFSAAGQIASCNAGAGGSVGGGNGAVHIGR
jgi:hypothetical protein